MTILEAILLGILQGATEFLPVSSSGHLVLIPAMFGLTEPTLNIVAIAHLGTLIAVLIYFARDIWNIITAVLTSLRHRDPMETVHARLGWFILLGSIPAALLGLTLKDYFDTLFSTPTAAAIFLLITAALIFAGEFMRSGLTSLETMEKSDALLIGLAQALALFPGISRSGSTIVGGLIRGLNREIATRFSFLLGIPAILGAGLFALIDLIQDPNLNAQLPTLTITFITAAITGYACIHWLLRWVRQRSLLPFAAYCIALSLTYLIFFANLS